MQQKTYSKKLIKKTLASLNNDVNGLNIVVKTASSDYLVTRAREILSTSFDAKDLRTVISLLTLRLIQKEDEICISKS